MRPHVFEPSFVEEFCSSPFQDAGYEAQRLVVRGKDPNRLGPGSGRHAVLLLVSLRCNNVTVTASTDQAHISWRTAFPQFVPHWEAGRLLLALLGRVEGGRARIRTWALTDVNQAGERPGPAPKSRLSCLGGNGGQHRNG